MTGYNVLLFVHILAAVIWLGGGAVLALFAVRGRTSPSTIQAFAAMVPYVGIRVFMPAVVLLPITGIWMVLIDSEWKFEQEWVRVGIGLFLVAFALGAVYLSRVGIAMGQAAGSGAAELGAIVNRWLVGYAVTLVVLLLVVADMVFKPGAS